MSDFKLVLAKAILTYLLTPKTKPSEDQMCSKGIEVTRKLSKSAIKDTQVYLTSLAVHPRSHRKPVRAYVWRILLSRVF